MATSGKNPKGYHTVTPCLSVSDGTRAIEFYKKAFGAEASSRMDRPDGTLMHATIKIGDSTIMLGQESTECGCQGGSGGGRGCSLYLYAEDVDAVFDRAVKSGATAEMPPQDMFWGDRAGRITDPFGHHWFLASHKEDLTEEQIRERAEEFFASAKAK